MNVVVVYYSGKGSNRFLAEKAARALNCEAIELVPRVPALVMPAAFLKFSFGNKPLKTDFSKYDRVVLCGPLYIGTIAAPCNDFIKKRIKNIRVLDFITCCGSTDEKKDDKFGYALVFGKLRELLGDKCGNCEAFPVGLVLSDAQKNDDQAGMNTRLNNDNFTGKIKERLDAYISKLVSA